MSDTTIAVYDEFVAQLASLREYNASVVFDYGDPAGNKEARSHIYKLRQTKSAVEAARKKEKAASLEYGRKVDAEAKEIIGEIQEMIDIHAKPIQEIEDREKERIAKHQNLIDGMYDVANQTEHQDGTPLTADDYRMALAYLEGLIIDGTWEEFEGGAAIAKDQTIGIVKKRLADREQFEAEQAELARLRAAEEARKEDERLDRVRAEAAERAKREMEEAAKREREEAEKRELVLKLEAEEAKRRAAEAEAKAKRELDEKQAREEEEKKRREANKAHKGKINRAIVSAMLDHGLDEDTAKTVVRLVASGKIPNMEITY